MRYRVAGLVALSLMAGGMASAQSLTATPNYGEMTLATGFDPDPYEFRMQAGGPLDAADGIGHGCRGYIAAAPDINFIYQAIRIPLRPMPLNIFIDADADTTLIIHAPDGNWYCNDDYNGLNPALMFDEPESGTYSIWVGTYRAGATHPASIMFSETTTQ